MHTWEDPYPHKNILRCLPVEYKACQDALNRYLANFLREDLDAWDEAQDNLFITLNTLLGELKPAEYGLNTADNLLAT